MKIDVDLPKFDIPKDFIVGDGIMGDILNMYGLFPCKIKAGVFAFCTRGTIRVTII
ncbi:AraC family transcriptional regulator, partial [Parabacteroides merdae]|nr:AraC family transcriptional regulator [Parabacteroides merdae]